MEDPAKRSTGRRGSARLVVSAASAIFLLIMDARGENPVERPVPIAVVDFDYIDTSGEARNQADKHRALLAAFVSAIRDDLARGDKYRVIALACQPEPCTVAHVDPATLLGKAREAGVSLLLYGGIHKASTLVQWAKVQVVDVAADKLVFDRLLTFRGDDERAWRRAEAFLVRDLKTYEPTE